MSYLQVQGINDLLRLESEQSLEQLNIRNYDLKAVKFIAILPKQCLSNHAKLDLNFVLISTNSTNVVESKLKITKSEMSLQLNTTDTNDSFYLFECNCEIPFLNEESNHRIIYYYYLKDELNNLTQVENLVNERKQCRVLDLNGDKISKSLNRLPSLNEHLKEQIDGLILFNPQNSYSNSAFTQKWNFITLNCLSRIDYLFSKALTKESHSSLLYRLKNIYKCFNISEMRIVFDKFLVDKFSKELDKLDRIEYLDDWQYISLLTMFYILSQFDVQFRDNLEFLKLIFKLHKPRLMNYFKSLKEYFTEENRK